MTEEVEYIKSSIGIAVTKDDMMQIAVPTSEDEYFIIELDVNQAIELSNAISEALIALLKSDLKQ